MKLIARRIKALLIVLIAILPEYFRLFGQPVYQYLALALVMLTVVTISGTKKRKFYYIAGIVFLLAISNVLPRAFHGDFGPTVTVLLVPVSLVFSVFCYLENDREIESFIKSYIFVGILIGLFGIVEFVGGVNVFSLIETEDLGAIGSLPYYRDGLVRVEGPFGTAIACGIYMNFVNILCLYKLTTKHTDVIYRFGYLFSIVIVLLTQSRMALLTLLLGQLLYWSKFSRKKRAGIVLLVGLVLLLDALTVQRVWGMIKEYLDIVMTVFFESIRSEDVGIQYRGKLFAVLMPVIQKHMIFGYGQEFVDNFTFMVWQFVFNSIDNNYLKVLLQYGLIGLCGQLAIFAVAIRYCFKLWKFELSRMVFTVSVLYLINLLSVCEMSENRSFYIVVPIIIAKYWQECKAKNNRVRVVAGDKELEKI